MSPGRCAEVTCVVVGISRPREPVVRHLVPFFARDLASLTANTDSRIGEETDFNAVLHISVGPLIRALETFADHEEELLRKAGTQEMDLPAEEKQSAASPSKSGSCKSGLVKHFRQLPAF